MTEITNLKTVPTNRGTKLKTMYALKNKVQLIGNLGGKPEVKEMENGKKLATFSIATSESYRNAKGECDIRLPDTCKVKVSAPLLDSLNQWLDERNVEVVY